VTLTNTFDAVGNRTVVKDSFGGTATSTYDNANQLTSKQFSNAGATPLRFDLTYTARNQVATLNRYSDLNGNTKVGESDYTYDAVARVQNIQHKNGSSTVLANYTYTYDLASRVTAEKLNGTATSYSYDNTNQVTNDGTNAYSYDANGNRTMTGYTTGSGNQLTNDGVYTYTYDKEANLIKKSKGASAETWTFGYDNRNQLISVEERSTDGGTLLLKATYTYDVYNRRVQEDKWLTGSGTTTVRLAYDSDGTVLADLDGSNSLQTRYWYRPGAVAPVSRIASASTTWLLEDHLGSVRNSTDGTGALTGTVVYDVFGKITTETSVSATGRYRYTGLFQDRDEKLAFADRRVYDVATGRWVQQDPIQFQAGDADLYRYVGNDATNHTDRIGLAADDIDVARIVAAANLIAAEQWKRVNAGMEPTDDRVVRILKANGFLPSQFQLAEQLSDLMIQEMTDARLKPQRNRGRNVYIRNYAPDISELNPLGPGDLVVLSANRSKEVSDEQFQYVAGIKGFKIALTLSANKWPLPSTPGYHVSMDISSISEFREALNRAAKRWGRQSFKRILVKSHCGGPSQRGPSIQFDPSAPSLTAESLDPATIRSIQGALDPDGVFVISTCGYKFHAMFNFPPPGKEFLSPRKWDKELQRWANKLNRKVTADWSTSSPDTLEGSVQFPPEQGNRHEPSWLGQWLWDWGLWRKPPRASAVPQRTVSDSLPYRE
jgi:RHS repeat-associated protein